MKKIIILMLSGMMIISCKKGGLLRPNTTIYPFRFNTVAILGNSITFSPQNLFKGWNGNWGMAATSAESDYVHLLTAKFQNANPACRVAVKNIMQFEENWEGYNLADNLDSIRNLNPDLLILRIGEDVAQTPLDKESFGGAYKALVEFFGPKTVVLGVGSFWPHPVSDEVMAKYTPFVSLAPLGQDKSNYSYSTWPANSGIGQHPNDKAMEEIADVIWERVQHLKPIN
jgi:hypothetical protein